MNIRVTIDLKPEFEDYHFGRECVDRRETGSGVLLKVKAEKS